ncbi:acetolactate synthase large subunit [Rhodothalassium salexigens DSM 2132]|uniref:Acetolactate synthase large subunit n=1 Tax=Rhodothalassium salexigens DSM 2132 TaxID=1188247 RepID=A0A4R2PQB3_RHOSA|nr:thiamine pyrophosphate-dependent enzyme [Rhodothalassium salexigens]MBB4210450.1 acetolactate synthase-1/2/3 large subunit [Rhodothalassium salexigens DSM 2132]MBK1638226.1 thiamine pyrophosphate-binding protein [Rhodothalassium salexigens DSM 2132]TCP37993.1 acetolactate synthase large subunit [Rhodothalassium salexigens DSM 2132]
MTETMPTGAEILVETLIAHGVEQGFCVPGESYLAVLDALYDARDRFRLVTCRHEAGAANMAEAWGKFTGAPAACFVTRGPGATHAAIGVHTAFQDSTPMILFVGQVASDQRDREAFQEVDYRQMFAPLAKWVAEVDRADRVGEYVARAVATATAGRPGPVVLALPEDMLTQAAARPAQRPHAPIQARPAAADLDAVVARLNQARRPLAILGGFGWTAEAVAAYAGFAERHSLPTAVAFRFQDLIDNDHPAYAGDLGLGANPDLVERLARADLVLAIGPRLGEVTTGGYTRLVPPVAEQALIHVHAGAEELGRVYQADLRVHANPGAFAAALAACSLDRQWPDEARAAVRARDAWRQPVAAPGAVNPAEIWAAMAERAGPDAIVTNGAGNFAAWVHRFHRYRRFRSQLAPTSGAMGYGVPAAVAAKLAAPQRPVICAAGDGDFLMSASELATAAQYRAGVVFLVFDNAMYGTIRMHQEKHYPGRVSATGIDNPDFVMLARAHGAHAERVDSTAAFAPAFDTALAVAEREQRPALLHILLDPRCIGPTFTLKKL